jgi:hypothetical protein
MPACERLATKKIAFAGKIYESPRKACDLRVAEGTALVWCWKTSPDRTWQMLNDSRVPSGNAVVRQFEIGFDLRSMT